MPRSPSQRRVVLRRRAIALVLLGAVLAGGIAAAAQGRSGGSGNASALTDPLTDTSVVTSGAGTATQPAATPPTTTASIPSGDPVTIEWVGDMVLASSFGMPPDSGRGSLAAVVETLRDADITFGNLEETLSTRSGSKCSAGSSDCYAFQAPPAMGSLLRSAGFEIMNMANNHAFDYGSAGRAETLAALRRVHVASTGAPGQITVLTARGTRVAFLGFAPYPWAARLDRIPEAVALVNKATTMADLVVVAIHAGAEGSTADHVPKGTEYFLGENRGNSRAFAHEVVNAGADLVVGSGPHVLRGIEQYHGRLIAYSLGNFAGFRNFALGGTLSLSGILSVTLLPNSSWGSARLIPVALHGAGLPELDPTNASVRLVARLSHDDFGAGSARFEPNGVMEK